MAAAALVTFSMGIVYGESGAVAAGMLRARHYGRDAVLHVIMRKLYQQRLVTVAMRAVVAQICEGVRSRFDLQQSSRTLGGFS